MSRRAEARGGTLKYRPGGEAGWASGGTRRPAAQQDWPGGGS